MMVSKLNFKKIQELVDTGQVNVGGVCAVCRTRRFTGMKVPACNSSPCRDLQTLCCLAKAGYDCDVYTMPENGALVAVLVMPTYNKWGKYIVYHDENDIIIGDESWESYDQYGADAETMAISDFCKKIGWPI